MSLFVASDDLGSLVVFATALQDVLAITEVPCGQIPLDRFSFLNTSFCTALQHSLAVSQVPQVRGFPFALLAFVSLATRVELCLRLPFAAFRTLFGCRALVGFHSPIIALKFAHQDRLT